MNDLLAAKWALLLWNIVCVRTASHVCVWEVLSGASVPVSGGTDLRQPRSPAAGPPSVSAGVPF